MGDSLRASHVLYKTAAKGRKPAASSAEAASISPLSSSLPCHAAKMVWAKLSFVVNSQVLLRFLNARTAQAAKAYWHQSTNPRSPASFVGFA
jgi:hypothetical protein